MNMPDTLDRYGIDFQASSAGPQGDLQALAITHIFPHRLNALPEFAVSGHV
jgi:hypothetical protein